MRYTLQVGDECIVAPLSLFNTELLNVTGSGKKAKVQKPVRQQPDPEDCFDAEYLRETGVCNFVEQCSSYDRQSRSVDSFLVFAHFREKGPEINWIKIQPKVAA